MLPKQSHADHHQQLPRAILPVLGMLIIACGALATPGNPGPTSTPFVVTVLVQPTTAPASTDTPVAATPTVLLPTDTAAPPPPPDFPEVSRGGANGDNQDLFRTQLDFEPSYFLRMYVFYSEDPNEKFKAGKDGRDIQSVEFTVTSPDGGKQFYDHTEKTAGYCFFGGGEPDCNPWTMENGQYVWKSGGRAVQSGKYGLTITVTAQNGEVGTWLWNKQSGNSIVITVP